MGTNKYMYLVYMSSMYSLVSSCVTYVPPSWKVPQCAPPASSGRSQDEEPISPRFAFGNSNSNCCPTTAPPATTTCICGKKKVTKIVGGVETEVNEYPWMTALVPSNNQNFFFCGATLVASQFIITAAHCVVPPGGVTITASTIKAVIGDHDTSSTTETSLRKVIGIEKIIVHPNYVEATSLNDIAVLKLSENVDLSVYSPACLPAADADFTGQTAVATGWGTLGSGLSQPVILQEVDLPVVTDEVCQAAFDAIGSSSTVASSMVCAGADGKDTCQGDSGGPLVVDVSSQFQLIGATSFGDDCAQPGLYGVYTEISKFTSWIETTFTSNCGATKCSS